MGRTSASKLVALHSARLSGLKQILNGPMEEDEHAHTCVRFPMARDVWKRMAEEISKTVCADSDLIEMLDVDLRGGHCGPYQRYPRNYGTLGPQWDHCARKLA